SFSTTPSLVSVIFAEEIFRNEPMLIEKISEVINKNDQILTAIITEGQNSGELRSDMDAKNLSIVIMGSLRLFIKKWQFSGFSFDLPLEGQQLVESIKLIIKK
ncbi:MAG: TetR/AcrR family transcriptional regulator, partial [Bacteroidetes bacterium]|nr:TetR/AcrR family transcriptional regulator [Bacteroidota bacterium]